MATVGTIHKQVAMLIATSQRQAETRHGDRGNSAARRRVAEVTA
jgi:hypothetical protein